MGAACSLADYVSNTLRQEVEAEEAAEGLQGSDLPRTGQGAYKDAQQHLPDTPRPQVGFQTAGQLQLSWAPTLDCCCMPV